LIQNVAKDQDGKNLLPVRPAPGPVFRRAFARFLLASFLLSLRAERGNIVAMQNGFTNEIVAVAG